MVSSTFGSILLLSLSFVRCVCSFVRCVHGCVRACVRSFGCSFNHWACDKEAETCAVTLWSHLGPYKALSIGSDATRPQLKRGARQYALWQCLGFILYQFFNPVRKVRGVTKDTKHATRYVRVVLIEERLTRSKKFTCYGPLFCWF